MERETEARRRIREARARQAAAARAGTDIASAVG